MEESHLSQNPAHQEDSWTCQHCGWVYPNAHPSAKHRRNHKKHCGKIRGLEQYTERHKGGSSDEASSDDGKDSLQHQPDNQYESTAPVERVPAVHTTSDSVLVKPMDSANKFTQNVHATDIAKSECSTSEHQPITEFCASTSRTLEDERDAKMEEPLCAPTNSSTVSDSAGLWPDQVDRVIERELVLGNALTKEAGGLPSVDELSRTNETKDGASLPQVLGKPKNGVKSQVADSDKITEIQREDVINLAQDSLSHQAIGNMGLMDKSPTFCEEKGSLRVAGTEEHLNISQMPNPVQVKEGQNREIMTPTASSISREGSLKENEAWKCHHCGWIYPNPHPSAKHRRNHRKNCRKLKRLEGQIVPHEGGSSVEVSSDEEMKEIDLDKLSNTSPLSNQSEELSSSGKDISYASEWKENVFGAPHEFTGDSRSNANELSALNVLPSDGFPTDVGSSRSSKSEGNGDAALLPPSTHLKASILASESLNSYEGREAHQNGKLEGRQGSLKVAKHSSLTGETSNDEFADDVPHVLGAQNALECESLSERSNLVKDAGLPLEMMSTNGADNANLKNVLESRKNVLNMQVTSHPVDVVAKDTKGKIETPKVTEMPVLSVEGIFVVEPVSQKTTIPENRLQNDKPSYETPTTMSISSLLHDFPDNLPLQSDKNYLESAGLPLDKSTNGAEDANLKNELESESPIEILAKDDKIYTGLETVHLSSEGKTETLKVTELLVQSVDSMASVVDPVSPKTIPEDRRGDCKPGVETPTTMAFASLSTDFRDKLPLQSDDSHLTTSVRNQLVSHIDAVREEICTNNIGGGPPTTEVLAGQSLDIKQIEEKSGRSTAAQEDEGSTLKNIESKSEALPERELSVVVPVVTIVKLGNDSSLSRLSGENDSGQLTLVKEGNEDTGSFVSSEDTFPAPATAANMENDSGQCRSPKESWSEPLPEREPSVVVPTITIVNLGNDSSLSRLSGESDSSQLTFVKEGNEDKGSFVLSEDMFPAPATAANMENDSGQSRSPKESWSSRSSLLKKDNEDTEPSVSVEHPLSTTAIGSVANDSDLPKSCKESDLNRPWSVKECSENQSPEWTASLEPLEKPEVEDLGSSGRSLKSFSKADSDSSSQRLDLAALSHKLSDSLDIFEDAADTLDACSVGGSVEESEDLDETRQASARFQEESKPSGITSLDEESNHEPHFMSGLDDKLNVMDSKEMSKEETSRPSQAGTSHSLSSRVQELRAPSPEAWQEPGPSAVRSRVAKRSTSEVTEDRKSSESHSALRRLMAEEEADKVKVNEAAPSASAAVNPKALAVDEPPANVRRRKTKSRSFWSHCICCSAVH